LHQAGHFAGLGNVARQRENVGPSLRRDLVRGPLDCFSRARTDNERGAFRGKFIRDSPAQSAAGSGYECDFSFKTEIHCLSPRCEQ
jgi:hypothetical protein